MDDVVVRSRYPRHSTQYRRKKKNIKDKPSLSEKIVRQLLVSILILVAIAIIKGVDSPVTNYITNNVQKVISQNIELKGIFESIDGLLRKIRGEEQQDSSGNAYQETVLPASTDETDEDGSPSVSDLKLINPIEGTLVSPYGERNVPLKNTPEFHQGIDIETVETEKVRASLAGEIIEASADKTYGNYVKIEHAGSLTTLYAHCSQLLVQKGQKVNQGDIIAEVGDTGVSVGAHLHFEIWENGKPVDPLKYINVPLK